MDKEFGSDMLRIAQGRKKEVNFSIVCKYLGCPFRIQYEQAKEETSDGKTKEIFKYKATNTNKTHSIQAHTNKDLRCSNFL